MAGVVAGRDCEFKSEESGVRIQNTVVEAVEIVEGMLLSRNRFLEGVTSGQEMIY
jgi:hypothetical protein